MISRKLRRWLIGLWFAAATVTAAPPVIELHDGTRIRGEIIGLENGVYAVRSEALGTLEIRQQDVRHIDYGTPPAGAADAGSQARIQALQRDLAGNGEIFASIHQLQNDPQLQAILADPEIMRAVSAGDLTALMANEKFLKLFENPAIRAITAKVAGDPDTR